MESFGDILLQVWREACRHIHITESTNTVARMLLSRMPLGCVVVCCLDEKRPSLELAAIGPTDAEPPYPETRLVLRATDLSKIQAWCKKGQVAHRRSLGHSGTEFPDAILPETPADWLAGPLLDGGAPVGILFFIAIPGQEFENEHIDMARVLLEPFSAALENDRRLRETEALREAAEADRRSLLNRLGRKDLADVIVGADSGLRAVLERVTLASPSDVPVLIFGETGTGKELIARAIHKRSPRASAPIIRVNCGAIPQELIDAQLFGHERGAFTGAVGSRQGWFERADGGTLFLDEIGELPLAAQVRLLRILQDGWLERIGGRQPIHVDVRIVAATHRDLAAMVSEGRFREDLWYRIAVFPILLPPLRDRIQDIPVLARHFAERAAIRYGLPLLMPDEHDIALLASYSWPGNVRELGSVMDRAAIIGNGHRLEVSKALGVLASATGNALRGTTPQTHGAENVATLDEAIRHHIETALTVAKGKIEGAEGAAAMLGVNAQTLRARMRKLGIDWLMFRSAQSDAEPES